MRNQDLYVEFPNFECFQLKKNILTPRALLLAICRVQRVWRAASSLGLRGSQDSCRILWGYKSAQFSSPTCFFTGVEPHFPGPPFILLSSVPSDLRFISPWAYSFIACCMCQSLDIRDTAMNKYTFEFCLPPRFQPLLIFSLGLSVSLFLFFLLFLYGAGEYFRSIWGLMETSFHPLTSRSDSTRQLGF